MGRRLLTLLVPVALIWVALAPNAQAYSCGTAGDDFDRSNGTNMGPNWVEQQGDWAVSGNAAMNPESIIGVMTFAGANQPNAEVCVDVLRTGTSAQSTGIVLGYQNMNVTNYVRLRSGAGEGTFRTVEIYDSEYQSYVSLPLGTRFATARLHARQFGSAISLDVDRNNDGIADETYSSDLGSRAATGPGAGVVGSSGAIVDTFRWAPYSPPVAPPSSAPPSSAPTPSGTAPVDRVKPVLGGISLSRGAFAAAGSGAALSAKRKRKSTPVGTKLTFNLSEASTVRFSVQRKTSGRRVSGKCKARTRANRKKRRCTRWTPVRGSFTFPGKAGRNSLTFRGRIGGKKLPVGSYRLSGTATDPARNSSLPRNKAFRIVK